MAQFEVQSESIAGAPTITFQFHGDTVKATLDDATLYGELLDLDRAELTVKVSSEVIADIMVRKLPRDENITVSMMAIGSALLWSHHRWCDAMPIGKAPPDVEEARRALAAMRAHPSEHRTILVDSDPDALR